MAIKSISSNSPIFPVSPQDSFGLQVAKGDILGHTRLTITGRKDGISASALDDVTQIPGTTVVPNPGGIQLEVVSTQAADDGDPVATGIRTIEIVYLDTSGIQQFEVLTMNGVAAVTTVATDIDKIQWMHAITAGSVGVSAGNISLQGVGAGTVYEFITAGGNRSLSCRYHVPSDVTAYIKGWHSSAITKKLDFRLRATMNARTGELLPGVFVFVDSQVLEAEASGFLPFEPEICVPSGATIKVSALGAVALGDAGGSFNMILVDN